jgi:hypothetical protein
VEFNASELAWVQPAGDGEAEHDAPHTCRRPSGDDGDDAAHDGSISAANDRSPNGETQLCSYGERSRLLSKLSLFWLAVVLTADDEAVHIEVWRGSGALSSHERSPRRRDSWDTAKPVFDLPC